MLGWSRYPTIYEINTWVWLSELSAKKSSSVGLASVPPAEWDAIAELGFDAVWLMGVWERSPASIAVSNHNQGLLADFRRALPDFRDEDNVGSPYCVRRYVVDQHLGGPEGLACAREELSKRGMRLILDFVPNHVAPDHPWVIEHPEYFIQGTTEDVQREPGSYIAIDRTVFACGKDLFFPAWQDVLQLNALVPELRRSVIGALFQIATQCDGVRCDMAMLLLNSVFERTWAGRVGPTPPTDYWHEVIPPVKRVYPDFLFIAEAYWDLEWELQEQGFDFCYDKRLYDRLEHASPESVRLHLYADASYQGKLLRFLENHDEPRAAAAFGSAKERAAAVVTSTLTGARMFHEGQFEGRKVILPVFLARRPDEAVDRQLQDFYRRLLEAINSSLFRDGQWQLCERKGWCDNRSYENFVAWSWRHQTEFCLVVVNLSDAAAQGRIVLASEQLRTRQWRLIDLLSGTTYDRDGDEMLHSGLYIDLGPWSFHVLRFVAAADAKGRAAVSAN